MRIFLSNKVKLIQLLAVLITLFYIFPTKKTNAPKEEFKIVIPNDSAVNLGVEYVADSDDKDDLKYILLWTSARNAPLAYIGEGQKGFVDRKCPYTNCFVTGNKNHLKDITKFDVIAFAGPDVIRMYEDKLPVKRSPHQKYAFASIESSDNYPVCSNRFDSYFNWTWTFKLDSDVRWGYMVIRDHNNNVVGPNKEMHWIKHGDMDPVSDEFKERLKSKSKAAAWYVSSCRSRSKREQFVKELQKELKQFDLTVDVYGKCGPLQCSRAKEAECFDLIKEKYYFYLSFENSFSEDYVTEKLLNAVWNNAVPIVYGAANYSRFIADGAYLNARDMGAEDLAAKMNQLIQNPDDYAEYFRWKNHYSYHRKMDSVYTDEYCLFCSILNDKQK
ncbi:Uncharacterized protein OBRU01_24246, partial [Operophtera brumata]